MLWLYFGNLRKLLSANVDVVLETFSIMRNNEITCNKSERLTH